MMPTIICGLVGGAAGWVLSGPVQSFVAPRWSTVRHRAVMAVACAVAAAAVGGGSSLVVPPSAASGIAAVAYVVLGVVGILLVIVDIAVHRLPDVFVFPAGVLCGVLLTAACLAGAPWWMLARAAAGAIALGGFYLLLHAVGPHGMGAGDVKLAALLGLLLGWAGWDAVAVGAVAAFVLGGLFGSVLMLTRRIARTGTIAFGPWMLAGAWTGLLTAPVFTIVPV